jgi:hypothetical protein
MSLTEYHCEIFEVEARFKSDDFDKEAFLKEIEPEHDHDPTFRWSFGSTEKRNVEHAHLSLTIPTMEEDGKETKGRIILAYHSSDAEIDDVRPPYMEDVTAWLGKFLKSDELPAYVNAFFRFGEEYESTLSLPFPLVTENKALSGSTVSGVTIEPPTQSPLLRVMIQRTNTDTIIYAMGRNRINLKTFDISKEVEKISTQVQGLIKEKKESN